MNRKNFFKNTLISIFILSLLMNAAFLAGTAMDIEIPIFKKVVIDKSQYQEYAKFKKMIRLKYEIEDKYYKDIDEDKLVEGAVNGMFASLNDRYSYYIPKEELERKKNSEKGVMIGIGITINILENGNIKIVDLDEEGSAKRAGLKAEDIIVSIDGMNLTADNVLDAINIISEDNKKYIFFGDYPTVSIEVKRDDKKLKFDVEREKIIDKAFSYKTIDGIGYINIERFIKGTPKYFKEALEDFNRNNIDELVIDIRDNPGGLLDSVVDVTGYLVGKKEILYTKNKSGDKKIHESPNEKLYDGKLCILVNENSASASEAMTAALKDYKRAKVIGTNTFGKGIVQTTYSFADGTGYKLTTNEYFSPKGKTIHTVGVSPDIEIKEPAQQLEVAVKLLKEGN